MCCIGAKERPLRASIHGEKMSTLRCSSPWRTQLPPLAFLMIKIKRSRMLNIHHKFGLFAQKIEPNVFSTLPGSFLQIKMIGGDKTSLLLTTQGRKVKKKSSCKLPKWPWNRTSSSPRSYERLFIPLCYLRWIQEEFRSSSLTLWGRRWGIVRLVFDKQSALIRINYFFWSEASFPQLLRVSCYFNLA